MGCYTNSEVPKDSKKEPDSGVNDCPQLRWTQLGAVSIAHHSLAGSACEGLGLFVLLELALEDIDAEVYGFLEAVTGLIDEEVGTVHHKFDGGFLVVCYFGLDNLEDDFGCLYIIGEAGQLVELLLDEVLELLGGIEVDGLNSDVHS